MLWRRNDPNPSWASHSSPAPPWPAATARNPLSPGASTPGSTAAGPGGTTLKAGTPVAASPSGDDVVDTLTPTLQLTNIRGTHQSSHTICLRDSSSIAPRTTSACSTRRWLRARATPPASRYPRARWPTTPSTGGAAVRAWTRRSAGWSTTSNFRTLPPPRPVVVASAPVGSVGPTRDIGANEVLAIIINYHNASRADLGRNSSRESRVAFFWSAMAIVHYGHPQFNPAGGDPGWCVKDAGGGRPPSDDVIVRAAAAIPGTSSAARAPTVIRSISTTSGGWAANRTSIRRRLARCRDRPVAWRG